MANVLSPFSEEEALTPPYQPLTENPPRASPLSEQAGRAPRRKSACPPSKAFNGFKAYRREAVKRIHGA